MSFLVKFGELPWEEPVPGLRVKVFSDGDRRIRLVEFSHGYVEPDWCRKGHMAHVVDGEFSVGYDGWAERYKKGDTIFIPEGEQSRHKPVLAEGESVTLLFFETARRCG